MNIFKYCGYSYLAKTNTLTKKDIENIMLYIAKDRQKDITIQTDEILNNTRKHIKDNAKKYEIVNIALTKKYHTPDILLRNKKTTDIINHKSKLINFKFYDLFKYNKDYTKLIRKYLNNGYIQADIQCKLNMSGYTKALWDLKSIENGVATFSFNRNISSTLQINFNKIQIIDNNLYLYYLDKPYIFEIIDKVFLDYFKKHTSKHITGARGYKAKNYKPLTSKIKQASSVDTQTSNTDDRIKQAYNDLKAQNFSDCQFEILGEWLWVTTLSEQVKNYLLEHNFKFSLQHLKFYLHFDKYKKRCNTILSYDKIKELYGGTI